MTDAARERWQRIADLFDRAVELEPGLRADFLRDAGDPEVAAEVESLLAAEERRGASLLEQAAGERGAELLGDEPGRDPEESAGTLFGAYRILRPLGHGGMGAVYLAERADGAFEQRVALKVMRRDLASGELRQRFLRERQILAGLKHPHIARLLDGGLATDQRPYFILEYVDGTSITAWCDARRLGVRARLGLLLDVCAAVHDAHRNLVVHRDLKPSNILVTGEGSVKLLDFGIAKLLDTETGSPGATRTALRVLTPEYAAPEQFRGEAITTATDVYALGLLLYELLCGQRAHAVTSDTPLAHAIERLQALPARPSAALAAMDRAAASAISAQRSTTREPLVATLRGDLDSIALTALRPEPSRRYGSAEALASDLRRYLDGAPVAARGGNRRYRAAKFVRRHRAGVAALALATIGLAAGLTFALRQAALARREAARAEAVSSFLTNVFRVSNPDEARGRVVTARELLDQGARRIEHEMRGQPELQAEMMSTLGNLNFDVGEYASAETLLQGALARRRAAYGERSLEAAATMNDLGRLFSLIDRHDRASTLLHEALAIRREKLGAYSSRTADTMLRLAKLADTRGNYHHGKRLAAAALAIYRDLEPRTREVELGLSHALGVLSNLDWNVRDFAEGERTAREALAIDGRLFGDDSTAVSSDQWRLARLLRWQGHTSEAATMFRRSLELSRRMYGPDHIEVATVLIDFGTMLADLGNYPEAEQMNTEALRIQRKAYGPIHDDVATTYNNLAVIKAHQALYDQAAGYQKQAIEIWTKTLGPEHPYTLLARSNLGGFLQLAGQLADAETILRETIATRRRVLGDQNTDLIYPLNNLGLVCRLTARAREALALHEEALALARKAFGSNHRETAASLYQSAMALRELGRLDGAAPRFEAALAIDRALYAGGNNRTADVLVGFGELRRRQHALAEAERLLREGLAMRVAKLGQDDWRVAEARILLARCLEDSGQHAAARALFDAGAATLRAKLGPEHPTTRMLTHRL